MLSSVDIGLPVWFNPFRGPASRGVKLENHMATKLVKVKKQKLTDGSVVFDVVNIRDSDSEGRVIISAETEGAALEIADVINDHAVAVWGGA